jgi:UDP-3-O-[3-hydroxymyristoyl] glucosamine N-acyltransferase
MSISRDARIHPSALIGTDVEVGAFSIVHAGVTIEAGSRIGSFCEIGGAAVPSQAGATTILGARANIRSHTVVYAGVSIGADFETGHRVTIREGTVIGKSVRVGTLTDIQGDCSIDDYARLHSGVFVAKLCKIGRYAWLLPRVVLTNDPTPPSDRLSGCTVGNYSVVAAGALILPGVTLGTGSLVAAMACVGIDVPPGMVAMGVPARISGRTSDIRLRGEPPAAAYPWQLHFHRGYPTELVRSWVQGPHADPEGEDAT